MPDAKLRAAIYARYSTDLQSAASIDDQIRLCRERAEREGWEIVTLFDDRATSGASLMRPGLQRLIHDASARRFDIVVAEAMDRLSRNQADIAGLYQTLAFSGVCIETLAEGRIDEMHIGLKGTMNALFLKDLAQKTRRGLRGRIEQGKSGGGNAFGYRVLRDIGADGEMRRGDREIDPSEAAVVRRIFRDYAAGLSPNRIAAQLNAEAIPGPRGGAWDKSTIHGNPKRGTGVLNNDIYVGRLVWNRQSFVKDPATGRRQARPNPESAWIVTEVPELRIIDQALWNAVKTRQQSRKTTSGDTKAWQRRKPRFLFSGLVKCGCCGGGFSTIAQDRLGCSNSRNKGLAYCSNRTGISRQELEHRVLGALEQQLMDPDLTRIFVEEYIAERNRLAASRDDDPDSRKRELAKVVRDQDRLIDAILTGTPAERIKARMAELEARQKILEAELAAASAAPALVRMHPGMTQEYHDRVNALIAELTEPDRESAAKDVLRGLVEEIVVTPEETAGKRCLARLELRGALASILRLSLSADRLTGQQKASCEQEVEESTGFMVAGA